MKAIKIFALLFTFIGFLITSVLYSASFGTKIVASKDPFGSSRTDINPSIPSIDSFDGSNTNYNPQIPGYQEVIPKSEIVLHKISIYTDYMLGLASLFILVKGVYKMDIMYTFKRLSFIGVLWLIKSVVIQTIKIVLNK